MTAAVKCPVLSFFCHSAACLRSLSLRFLHTQPCRKDHRKHLVAILGAQRREARADGRAPTKRGRRPPAIALRRLKKLLISQRLPGSSSSAPFPRRCPAPPSAVLAVPWKRTLFRRANCLPATRRRPTVLTEPSGSRCINSPTPEAYEPTSLPM